MNQTILALFVGLLGGVGGALTVHFVTERSPTEAPSSVNAADSREIGARLERIEAALGRMPLDAGPSLRGSAPNESMPASEAEMDVLVAQLAERLEPRLQESVRTSVREAVEEEMDRDGGDEPPAKPKRTVTFSEAAAELGLTTEQEEAVRRIATETADEFFRLVAGEDLTPDQVRREFEDAGSDPALRAQLRSKYVARAMTNFGGLMALGLNVQNKMREAVGRENASRLEAEFEVPELDPYGIAELFEGG
ncbi:MAG: hypothetical protein ACYTG6_08695 [Planctomycetota bacterium]|jgi:hypothetical protein